MRAPTILDSISSISRMPSDHPHHPHHSHSHSSSHPHSSGSSAHMNGASTSSANISASSPVPGTSSDSAEYGADYVKIVGETIGITNISEQCTSQVGASTTFILKEIVEQAKKFAAHGRRRRMTADDIDAALAFRGYCPLFGLSSKDGLPFRLVGSTGRDLFVYDDRDLDVSQIVNASPPKVPVDTTVKAHWLVIDGEQPAVPENPTPIVEEDTSVSAAVEHLSKNIEHGLSILSENAKMLRKTEQVQIKTMTTHALSLEQQIFFKEVTEAIMGSDDQRRTEALYSLQTDAGIQVLLPRFSLAIAEGVRCNIVNHNLAILIYLMRMVQSLAYNPTISLDRCLHEILPAVLSCILSKQLCSRPDTDNHWALREFSSRLLSTLCKAYNVNGLRSRITQVLTRVWSVDNSTLSTLYGSLYALNELGVDTIRSVVIPRAAQLYQDIKRAQADMTNTAERIAADKTQTFVTKVLTNYVRTQRPSGLKDANDYRSMFGGFGDAIFRAISTEMTHTTTPSNSGSSSSSTSIASSSASASGLQRTTISDRRLTSGSNVVSLQSQQQRFVPRTTQRIGMTQQQQQAPVIRQQSSMQQGYMNVTAGASARLQPTITNDTSTGQPRPVSTTGSFYVTSTANTSNTPSYVVRSSGVKKVILSAPPPPQQRPPILPSSAINDTHRNV